MEFSTSLFRNVAASDLRTEAVSNREADHVHLAEERVAKSFETVFISQFVDEMMKTVGDEAMGGGEQASTWRTVMADALAENLVDSGGLGFSASIQQMLAAYQKS